MGILGMLNSHGYETQTDRGKTEHDRELWCQMQINHEPPSFAHEDENQNA